MSWRFPSGMSMGFGYLEYEKDVFNWQGAQIPWIGFDEVTHFSEQQFFYMLSRNRSTSGVKPRVRATCNPDPDSWVRRFIDWWIDPATGLAIKERSGKLRWFIRINDGFIWANSPDELFLTYGRGPEIVPKSVTFIAAALQDNKILMEKDPGYLGNLLALSRIDRERLLGGNWNVRATSGMYFREEWFQMLDTVPGGHIQQIRYWDRAATEPSESNKDPDWTRGIKLIKYPDGRMMVTDLKSVRASPGGVERFIKQVAAFDGHDVQIVGEQDPGSAGVADAEQFVRMLMGYYARTVRNTKDKETRAKPVSAQVEAGNIFCLRAPWNREFFAELENFPEGAHDDIIDTLSGAFNELCGGLSLADVV